MLVESGLVRATAGDGSVYVFRPSFGRIASLGSPGEIVALFAALHGPHAAQEAAYVLACLCDQDDASALIGWRDEAGWHPGEMPEAEQVIVARHLMRHGIAGTAMPSEGGGQYATEFHAAEYISAARVHLGLSSEDAEALSMTEFQSMFAMKFPDHAKRTGRRDVPSREEYEAAIAAVEARRV
jgi:hypothetical protein